MHKHIALGLASLAIGALAAPVANAQAPNSGSYVGIAGGQSKFRTDCSSVFSCDKKDTAWKVYGGGRFTDIFGLELGYTDFGKIRASGGDTKAWAANLSLLAGVPIGERFNIFAKAGGVYGRTDVDASPSTLFDTGHKSGWGGTYGVGAAAGITRNLQVRVDYDRYKLDFVGGRRDIDLLTAGVQYRF